MISPSDMNRDSQFIELAVHGDVQKLRDWINQQTSKNRVREIFSRFIKELQEEHRLTIKEIEVICGLQSGIITKNFKGPPKVYLINTILDSIMRISYDDLHLYNEGEQDYSDFLNNTAEIKSQNGWFYIDHRPEVLLLCDKILKDIDSLIAVWQSIPQKSEYLSPLQRDRLIDACETLIHLLKSRKCERGFIKGVSMRLRELSRSAAFLAVASGAAGGLATGAAQEMLAPDKNLEVRVLSGTIADDCDQLLEKFEETTPFAIEETEV